MKSDVNKKMRAIRMQLKLHNNNEKEKERLGEELRKFKKIDNEK